jgi:hypothetical protein
VLACGRSRLRAAFEDFELAPLMGIPVGREKDAHMTAIQASSKGIFVWRTETTHIAIDHPKYSMELDPCYEGYEVRCPFCSGAYVGFSSPRFAEEHWFSKRGIHLQSIEEPLSRCCTFCGFWYVKYIRPAVSPAVPTACWSAYDEEDEVELLRYSVTLILAGLRWFDFDDARLGLAEVGSHLSRHFHDIYLLAPRRFEELVADVYKHLGYQVRLTQQTRDGGYDIMLLEGIRKKQIIVECKRYAPERRITVGIVRQLLGVQLERGVPRGKIVATTDFTEPARATASKVNEGRSGYKLELVNADRLLKLLGVYNKTSLLDRAVARCFRVSAADIEAARDRQKALKRLLDHFELQKTPVWRRLLRLGSRGGA